MAKPNTTLHAAERFIDASPPRCELPDGGLFCSMAPVPVKRTEVAYRAIAPAGFALAWLASGVAGASRDELAWRRGALPPAGEPLLWFHGASAGEMAAAIELAALLRRGGRRFTAGYTTANRAGLELVRRCPDIDDVAALVPWDAPRWVARAFDRWRPKALFLVETELWPSLVFEAWQRRIPVLAVSARIYPRDVRRYRAIRPWIAPTLQRLAAIVAQDEVERARFVALGAPAERCVVAGNLKHLALRERSTSGAAILRRREPPLPPTIVFGSVHRDEIGTVFAALDQLSVLDATRRPSSSDARQASLAPRAIIAPRHVGDAAAIVRQAARRGWAARRSSEPDDGPPWRILALDRMGELLEAYAMGSVAVVGGSFAKHGGHNPLEPIAVGTPVMLGPNLEHFAGDAQRIEHATPEAFVDAATLGTRLAEWLCDADHRARLLARQRAALPDAAAIAARYRAAIEPWLDASGVAGEAAAPAAARSDAALRRTGAR